MAKKSGLGRGMDSIFVDNEVETEGGSSGTTMLRIAKIEPNPDQPRREFDTESLSELAESIATSGLIQPVAVRPSRDGFYTIIAGERRWRASKMAGLTEIPVIIMEVDDRKAAELALIENVQRKDLNPIEEALGYKSLINEYDLTQSDLASRVGKSRVTITNALRLLELPDEVLQMVSSGQISTGHARAILGLKNSDMMLTLALAARDNDLSVRAVEEKVRKLNTHKETVILTPDPEKIQKDEYFKVLESKATERIGSKVKIKRNTKNKQIVIDYENHDELEDILKRLCGADIFKEID